MSTRYVTFDSQYRARDLHLTGEQLYHSIHAKGENVEDVLRQAEAEEAVGKIAQVEEGQQEQQEQQEQQMETEDVEAPEVVPETGRNVSEAWRFSFFTCIAGWVY